MKIFIDTAPFIYLLENHPVFTPKIKTLITNAIVVGDYIVTNVVTLSEFGVKPTKDNRLDLIEKFEELHATDLFLANMGSGRLTIGDARNSHRTGK